MDEPIDHIEEPAFIEPDRGRGRGGWFGTILVRAVAPAWILFGAAMKWWNANPEKLPGWIRSELAERFPVESYYEAWTGLIKGIVTLELLAAVVMIFFGWLARPTALLMLAVFAAVALKEAHHDASVTGQSFLVAAFEGDCGCFGGGIPFLSTGIVALIDGALFGLILTSRPRTRPMRETRKPLAIAGVLAWVIAMSLGFNPRLPEHHGSEAQSEKYSPHRWVGWKFEETGLYEWLNYSVDPATYGGGKQTWFLYRETCPTCHRIFLEEYSEPELDHVVVAVRVVPGPDERHAGEPEEVTCPACQFVDIAAGLGGKYNIPTPCLIEVDEQGIITKIEDPLLHGQPQRDESGEYRHGTDEIREDWREQMKDE